MRTFYWKEIVAAAMKHNLDPVLVEAIVVKESSGNADAFRFERDFWNRYLKPNKLYAGKNPRRVSSSYGLMQVMFPVAVERGYPTDLHPELLFVPETALDYGCRQLRYLIDWANDGWPDLPEPVRLAAAVAAYNGGKGGNRPTDQPNRNATYAKAVLANYSVLLNERAGS